MSIAEEFLKTEDELLPAKLGKHDVFIKRLTLFEQSKWELEIIGSKNTNTKTNFKAWYLAHCIVDKDGKRIFTDEQIDALGKKASNLNELYSKAWEHNHLTEEDEAELLKN